MASGIIKKWLPDRGFGFIAPDDGSDDLFAHISQVTGQVNLQQGDRVRFDAGVDDRSGKPRALNVALL